jgi:predicted nucleic acid-binding protein
MKVVSVCHGNGVYSAAVALDLILATDNEQEFSRVDGLRIENWLRE